MMGRNIAYGWDYETCKLKYNLIWQHAGSVKGHGNDFGQITFFYFSVNALGMHS